MWSDYPCVETDWPNRHPFGYGMRYIRGSWSAGQAKYATSNRVALEEKLGRPLLPGMWALHHCDWPPCVQQEHLYEGTCADNCRDASVRGRARGRFSGVLSVERRDALRLQHQESPQMTYRELGEEFGVSAQTAHNVVHRKYG